YSEERLVVDRDEDELRHSLKAAHGSKPFALVSADSGVRRPRGTTDPRVAAVQAWLGKRSVVPTEAVLVGIGADEAYVGETCGVALFKFAWDYFSPVPVR